MTAQSYLADFRLLIIGHLDGYSRIKWDKILNVSSLRARKCLNLVVVLLRQKILISAVSVQKPEVNFFNLSTIVEI